MKISILSCLAACLLVASCQTNQALPDTTGIPATQVDYTDRPAFLDAQKPGDFHKLLMSFTGNWQLQGSGYLSAASPHTTSGSMQVDWILNGNWLEMQLSERTLASGDTAFVRQFIGFDNLRQRYFLWSMATWSVTTQLYIGEWDANAELWQFSRTATVLRAGKPITFEAIIKIRLEDKNRMVWELWEQWHSKKINNGEPTQLWRKEFVRD